MRLAHLRNGSGSSKGISSRGAAGLEPATPGGGYSRRFSRDLVSPRRVRSQNHVRRNALEEPRFRGLKSSSELIRAGFLPDSFA